MGLLTNLVSKFRDATAAPVSMVGFGSTGGLLPFGVTSTSVLGLSAVWRSLDILSNGVAGLPWSERRGNLELPSSRLIQRPSATWTRREWVSFVVSSLALYDFAYLYKTTEVDSEGLPLSLIPVDPNFIQPAQQDYYSLQRPKEYVIAGREVSTDQLVVIRRSPLPGVIDPAAGVINLARATLATAISADNYASRFWQGGGATQLVLESDAAIPDPVAKQYSERWAERRAKGPDYAPVLGNGLKVRSLGIDPTQASAVEARKELVSDVGRYFGIPTALLNSPASDSETYSSTESQGIHLVTFTLNNYIQAIEDAISDLLPGGRSLVVDRSALSKGTALARAQAYQLAIQSGWMTVNDVREAENLPPLEISPAPQPALAASPTSPVGVFA